jgi:hypothetical protein
VHHNTSPNRLLIKPSHAFAGTRVPAAAVGPPPSSSPLRRFSKPGDLSSAFPGSHGSSPSSTWLRPAPSLTAVQVPAGAPPPLAGDSSGRSTATNRSRVSLIEDPHRLFAWPRSTSPPASLPPPSGPRGRNRGFCVKILKILGFAVQKDCSLFCELVQHLVKSIKNRRKIQK